MAKESESRFFKNQNRPTSNRHDDDTDGRGRRSRHVMRDLSTRFRDPGTSSGFRETNSRFPDFKTLLN